MSALTSVESGHELSAWGVMKRGVELSPELAQGFLGTIGFAVVATLGRAVVPVAVQQTLDSGLHSAGGPDLGYTVSAVLFGLAAILVSMWASYQMTSRLFASSERGLATLRIKAFRHVHDLSVLTQNTERRGALVSRVTSDVDQVSQFLIFGGVIAVVSVGQISIATVVMLVYSWQLALVVWLCFAPLVLSLRYFQRRLSESYDIVRQQVGAMLGAIAEPVVGAEVVRSYGIQSRTQRRIDEAIARYQAASTKAQGLTAFSFSLGGVSAGLANAGVITLGVVLGVDGDLTAGKVLAFAFLVNLFVGPVQMGTQVLTDAQNAFSGWRRVIGLLDTPADVVDPGEAGVDLPDGPALVEFEGVSYAYPDGPTVLEDVTLTIAPRTRVAVVGETGSGKTTLAKLLCRLMDPTTGVVRLDGVDLKEIRAQSLRQHVVLVPQEGFLFDSTLRANAQYGRIGAGDEQIVGAAAELGLTDWLESLPRGLDTRVGQRGEALSAGERQLVALMRAHLAAPDLLVLDEATSAVDPALEMRIARALERLTAGRTSVTIAHRMSTAEQADEVIVVDRGRVAQRGSHAELLAAGGIYGRLYASWTAQHGILGA
jgi:ABC-type multidrug transport system fused ATPase/permease subunit